MPVNEINITVDARVMPDFGLVAASYRAALERNAGRVGIFTLECNKYDEYDALINAINLGLDLVPQLLTPPISTYNLAFHSDYGENLWHTLMDKRVKHYLNLREKINSNPNTNVRTYMTRIGNNPLRNHTYIAAIQGLTGITVPYMLEQEHPQTWFLLQKVFTEAYVPDNIVGTPTIDNLRNNAMEIERVRAETPEVWQALEKAIQHHEERDKVAA